MPGLQLDTGFLSAPEVVEYPTEGGKTAFMNYYPPRNKDWGLPQGHLPPLLVMIHGGPTSQCSANLSLKYQFWTSRGGARALELAHSCACKGCRDGRAPALPRYLADPVPGSEGRRLAGRQQGAISQCC